MSDEFEVTERSRVNLFGNRGSHRKHDVYEVIDSSFYGTVAYSIDGQPFATPTMIWRADDYIYWHGSAGSRMLRTVAQGCKVSVTFVHVDGFVLSRLASAHAMNYRSVMVFGRPEPVESLDERLFQLEAFLTRLFPGRWAEVKRPSRGELKAIIMVRMRIEEGSLKKRAGLPADGRAIFGGEKLFEQRCWAGTLPLVTGVGTPQEAARLDADVVTPGYIVDFAERFGLKCAPVQDLGSFLGRVERVHTIAHGVKRFRIGAVDQRFPEVAAGAHLDIEVVLNDQTRDFRSYTIVDADNQGRWYEIAVLEDTSGRGGSYHLHRTLAEGSDVRLLPPRNDFPLDADAAHSVLLAGGIGVTPIIAMARQLRSNGRPFEVHYCARGKHKAALLDELAELCGNCLRFYDTSLGPDHRIDLGCTLGPYSPGRAIYVCGPAALIAAVTVAADRLGYPSNAIHREAFSAPPPRSTDTPISVFLAKSGRSVAVVPGESILDAALAAGVEVSHSCKRGECGLCASEVVSGDIDHRDHFLTPTQKAAGRTMCICVSWERSGQLVLDL